MTKLCDKETQKKKKKGKKQGKITKSESTKNEKNQTEKNREKTKNKTKNKTKKKTEKIDIDSSNSPSNSIWFISSMTFLFTSSRCSLELNTMKENQTLSSADAPAIS